MLPPGRAARRPRRGRPPRRRAARQRARVRLPPRRRRPERAGGRRASTPRGAARSWPATSATPTAPSCSPTPTHAALLEGLDLERAGAPRRRPGVDELAGRPPRHAAPRTQLPGAGRAVPADLHLGLHRRAEGRADEPGPGRPHRARPARSAFTERRRPLLLDAAVPRQRAARQPVPGDGVGRRRSRCAPKFSASELLPDVRRFGCTYFNYVGRALSYVLAQPERPDDADNPLKWCLGSEASPRDRKEFRRRFGCFVAEGYSSSEGAVVITPFSGMPPEALGRPERGHGRRRHRPRHRRRVPARPVRRRPAGCSTPRRRSARSSAASELSSFEGYYANPEATAERGRDGWYWTGDLGYRDEDGTFYFAGRTADWLRVDGENFAAGPIERILGRFPGVASAVVYGVPDPRTGDQVMAALELDAGAAFDAAAFDRVPRRRSPTSAPSGRRASCGSSTPSRSPPPARSTASRCGPSAGTTDRPGVVATGPRRAPTGGSPTTTSTTCAGRSPTPAAKGCSREVRHHPPARSRTRTTPTWSAARAWPRVAQAAEAAGFHGYGFTDHPAPTDRWLRRRRPRRPRPVRGASAIAAAVTDDAAPDPEHRGAPLPQPVRGGEGGGHARHALRRPLHPRRRGRLPQGRVRGARGRPRRAQRAGGRGARRDPGDLDRRRRHRRGPPLLGPRHHRPPAAGHPAAPADLDRRQQRPGPPAGGRPRRRLVPVPGPGHRRHHRPHRVARHAPSSWPRPSTTSAAASTPPAATPRPSTSRSPTRPAATRPATPSTPTPTSTGLAELAGLGVTWVQVGLPGDSVEHAVEVAQRYGEQVIAAAP